MVTKTGGRPHISVFIAVSVDGFIARPDGSIDWLSAVEREGEDYGYKVFFDACDTLVMGRKTYETVLGFGAWPYANKRCVVLTHRPAKPHHSEEFFDGSVADLAAKLGREGALRLYVDGGQVIRQFLAAGLIDDLTLSVVPVVLGAGLPLFGMDGVPAALTLDSTRAYESGLVQLRYRVNSKKY